MRRSIHDGMFKDHDFRVKQTRQSSFVPGSTLIDSLLKAANSRRSSFAFSGSGSRMQPCTVKCRIGYNAKANSEHLNYILRPGAGKDGNSPESYGSVTPDEMKFYSSKEKHQLRLIISPAHQGCDLEKVVHEVIRYIQTLKGIELVWLAANHTNTDNKHAHIIISGVDRNLKEVRLSYEEISNGLRKKASEYLTTAYGPVPQGYRFKKLRLQATSWIREDSELFQTLENKNGLSERYIQLLPHYRQDNYHERLTTLVKLGVVDFENGTYRALPNARIQLQAARRFNTFLVATKKAVFTHPSKVKLWSKNDGSITGKMTSVGFIDEINNNHYVLIEQRLGEAYFVPLANRIDLSSTPVGSYVKIRMKESVHIPGHISPIVEKIVPTSEMIIEKQPYREGKARA